MGIDRAIRGGGRRIVAITSTFPQYPGDPRGAFLLAHWEGRAAAGDRVWVLAPRSRWVEGRVGRRIGVERFAYAPRPVATLTGRFGILENLREAPWRAVWVAPLVAAGRRALVRAVERHRPDLVVGHMWLPFGLVAAGVARQRGIPFEVYGHGTDVDLVLAAPARLRRTVWALLAGARAVHLPSEEKARRVRAAGGGHLPLRVEPMVHCVPAPDPPPDAPRAGILFVGRLIRQKGVDVLLEAAARMADRPHVDVAGDGPERRRLERLAARLGVDARFYGYVEGAAKTRLLAGAAVVCVPSRPGRGGLGEGAPLVVCEALAHGARVVASAVGGIPELCGGDPRARLVPPGDPERLARALEDALAEAPKPVAASRSAGG